MKLKAQHVGPLFFLALFVLFIAVPYVIGWLKYN